MSNYARVLARGRYVPGTARPPLSQALPKFSPFTQRLTLRSFTTLNYSTKTTDQPRIQYNWIRGVEHLEDYEPGGYYPLMIGDKLQGRYQIVDKLGHGGYSTVWLTRDTNLNRYVALKVTTASSVPREPEVLKALSSLPRDVPGRQFIPELLDEFQVHGPNGSHTCYTLPLAACNLRSLQNVAIPMIQLGFARVLCYRLTQAVAYVHSQGYVHGDLHLNNILLTPLSNLDHLSVPEFYKEFGDPETVSVTQRDCDGNDSPLPPNVPAKAVQPLCLGENLDQDTISQTSLILNDFGEAFNPSLETGLGKDCRIPPGSRPPEATFEPETPLTNRSDIWSLATVLWEIIGMKPVFSHEYIPLKEVLAQHVDVLGPMPPNWWEKWEARREFFVSPGEPTVSYRGNKWPPLDAWFEEAIQKYRREEGSEIGEEEKKAFLDLMRRMLAYRPEERPTADEVLRSEWMKLVVESLP